MKFINKIERKLYQYRIRPFFEYLIYAMGFVYIMDLFFPSFQLSWRLMLWTPLILKGEIWRLFTFLVVPGGNSIIEMVLFLYFYYFIGTQLERQWGAPRFLIFYLLGALGAMLSALITGFGVNTYLYLSLFLAFAIQYPEYQVLLFFAIPVKMKWLALLDLAYYLLTFVTGNWSARLAMLFSLVPILIFFGNDLTQMMVSKYTLWKRRQAFRSKR